VAPGLVATEMGDRLVRATLGVESVSSLDQEQPFGRVCKPEDVAHVVRFLVSPDAGLITGQRIVIDGAPTRSPHAREGLSVSLDERGRDTRARRRIPRRTARTAPSPLSPARPNY